MIDILLRLEKSYDEVQMNKLLYDNMSFYKRLDFWVLTFIFITGGLALWLTSDLKNAHFYLILFMISMGLGGFLIINRENKKRLLKKKISCDSKLTKHWASEDYQKKKLKTFYKTLVDNKLLNNSKTDVKLIVEYEKICERESNYLKSNQSYLVGGGVLILFILPVWSEIIKMLLSETNDFLETMKLIISLIASIGFIIYLLSSIDKALVQFVNSTSRKKTHIMRLLRLLRMNLLIKKYAA